ncbi:MAG: long-chain fatty acid--CoA ligase [Magnetospirillum sp.]|nr:long-chain fatty acid--CoA ligase [Magnetospirillum sp.]
MTPSLDLTTCPSLTAMVRDQAERLGERTLLAAKSDGVWHRLSWRQTWDAALALAGGLKALGIVPGDRVALVSENRPEWAIADLAIMAAGAVTVPAYVTNTVADHRHILDNSGARAVIVSTAALAEKVLAAAWAADHAPQVIAIAPPHLRQMSGAPPLAWDAVLAMGRGREAAVLAQVAATRRDDLACVIYTSGTGGTPKGVMLSHGAILHNCRGATLLLADLGLEDEVFLSFLPLSHSYEHTAGLYFPLSLGAEIHYAEGLDHLSANIAEVRPTIMTAVPRLYESMRARMLRGIARESAVTRHLFARTLALGSARIRTGRLPPWQAVEDRVLEKLVRAKVRARMGGRLKAFVSGGAPLPYDLGLFFTALGVRILQGYGQTEAAPVISCNPPGRMRLETVGPPLADTEVRLAADGEILVKGELVMEGYWNDPDATRLALSDGGWLHTGDIGAIDSDGYIRITDRKKDIIVNSGGDNISPQRVEGLLTMEPEIAQAMVVGDRRPHLVALLVPAEEWATAWAQAQGRAADLAALVADTAFRRAVAEAVERVNAGLSPIEKVRKFTLSAEPFSVANSLLTPTMKIRRHLIREAYGAQLEALYEERR